MNESLSMQDLQLRAETEHDLPFLKQLYASTRWDEVAQTGWPKEQMEAFLNSQFDAQRTHYLEHFADSSFDIIEFSGTPVGRLYLCQTPEEFRIVDIALVPQARGKGIGNHLLTKILNDARHVCLPVRIHVEVNNPAMHLYERLGFQRVDDQGVYYLMEWIDDSN